MDRPTNFKVITNTTIKDNRFNIYKYNTVEHKKPKLINSIKTRKSLYNWSIINFPVFTYKELTTDLKIELNNIYLILEHMNKLQNILDELQRNIHAAGLSINIFINNLFNLPFQFHYLEHFVILRNHKLEIHNNNELDTALVQNEIQLLHYEDNELLKLIPAKDDAIYITNKQIKLYNQLYNKYNEYLNYNIQLSADYESACDTYEYLLESLQLNLPNISTINLTTTNKNEKFNINKHDLLLTNQNATINFFYVKKQYSKALIKFLNTKNKKKRI